jgi:hypothetical protein
VRWPLSLVKDQAQVQAACGLQAGAAAERKPEACPAELHTT